MLKTKKTSVYCAGSTLSCMWQGSQSKSRGLHSGLTRAAENEITAARHSFFR